MNLSATITGSDGFIGKALKTRLEKLGWKIYSELRPDVDYVFLFGSPSSDHWFKQASDYSIQETLGNLMRVAGFCNTYGIKLIYPSSGTIYNPVTTYSKTKLASEVVAMIYNDNFLGLRIFAGYGVGEGHKKEYASVVYQFIKNIKKGESPVIWGDGKQTRDFIYIDDIVETIISNLDKEGVFDIGTGENHSLNQVVKLINKNLKTNINPIYIPKPPNYLNHTICLRPTKFNVSLEQGIDKIINWDRLYD